MNDVLASVLGRLEKVRERQPGQWSARCPSHDDNGPSLSIRLGDNGGILLHCFGGCEVGEIVASLGLDLFDLFPQREHSPDAPKRLAPLLSASQALELVVDEMMFAAMCLLNVSRGVALTASDLDRIVTHAGRAAWLQRMTRRDYS